ncbi:helix-turn-helix domain-containing protein [Fluviibacterium sp. S390]|uniref:helix-turn-helix domain-containing protein n=1 Tax=Fluviibacterium sp. S390 TaxID=3415139 RepID=UPI003C7B623E
MVPDIHYIDEIENVFSEWVDWDYEIQQLASGPLGFGRRVMALGDVVLTWEWADKPMRVRLQLPGDAISVSLLLAGDRPAFWKGHELGADQVLVFGATEHDYFIPPAFLAVNISTHRSAMARFGLAALAGGLWDVPPAHLARLQMQCAAALRSSTGNHDLGTEILGALADLFQHANCRGERLRPSIRDETPRHRVLRLSEDLGVQLDQGAPIVHLADTLSVSTRTLHRTIKDLSGLSPKQYLDVLRLHRFRKDLLERGQSRTITSLAFDNGFEHVGRLSRFYQDWFGELPRETRRRQV